MTLQPAPGAGVVRRDAHTIPPREPRDGRRIGTPISAEEPQFDASRFWRLVFAVGRNLASYFVSQRAARSSVSRTGVMIAILVTIGQAVYETGYDADPVSRLWEAFRMELVTNFVWTSIFTSVIDAVVAYRNGDVCGKGYFVP